MAELVRGVESVELLRSGVDSLGMHAVGRYTWRSRLRYRLTFTMETIHVDPQTLIEGHATGELEGTGRWLLSHGAGVTHIEYDWQVTFEDCYERLA